MGHATHARDVRWLYRALGGAGSAVALTLHRGDITGS